jgi:hypothetical protein
VAEKKLLCGLHEPAGPDLLLSMTSNPLPAAEFRSRVDRGDYRGLVDDNLRSILRDATDDITTNGLVDEVGALRLLLRRLLVEETDLTKLTNNVTRVAAAAVQTARTQALISGGAAEGLTAALTQILLEVAELKESSS